jgi:membrane-bound inhibitor of C-type lysozyme
MLETIAKGRPEIGRPAAPPVKDADSNGANALADAQAQERAAQIRDQVTLEAQRERYDFQTEESAELDREYNNTRDMVLAQMKADDEIVKKYIEMI